MAIQTQGSTGNVLEVDTLFKAARVSLRPMEVLGWNSIGASTGNATALAALAPIFAFRNIGANPILVRRIGISSLVAGGFTAANFVDYGLTVARNWTASDSGGTAVALTGNNGKHRTSLATPTSIDCRIAAAAALTAGTRTLDPAPLSLVVALATAAFTGNLIPGSANNLLSQDTGDHPLILGQNEGIIIQNINLWGAGGIVRTTVNMEFAEAVSY